MEWLITVTGLPFDILILVLLAVAGAFAGFVDSIVGGGGLISVPAMLLTNLPPSVALGSNKLSSIFGAGSASITFLRNHMVDFSLVRKLLPFTFVGSMLGTLAVVSLPPLYVKPIIIILLVCVTLFVVFKKDWGEINRTSQVAGKALYICMAFALGIGIYDGFIGPGTGTFLIMGFSCGRAMLAELGLVGKAPGRYNLHLGGNRIGTRIPRMFRENITEPEILDSLDVLIGRWAKEREAGEGFGDFTVRAGIIRPVLDPARDFWE